MKIVIIVIIQLLYMHVYFFYISYEFRIFGMQEHLPMVHGDSMLHARNVDPKTGEFYDIGFGVRYTDGYGYLPPNAVSLYITVLLS